MSTSLKVKAPEISQYITFRDLETPQKLRSQNPMKLKTQFAPKKH